ncbi:MAG: hypothetical protein ACHQUC_09360 [Chlamydiales bacterium]
MNNVRALFQTGCEKSIAKLATIDKMAGDRDGMMSSQVFLKTLVCDISPFLSILFLHSIKLVQSRAIEKYAENLEENLKQLRTQVLSWTYKPTPVRRVEIPKPRGKGMRLLGVPIIKDRVLHMAIK